MHNTSDIIVLVAALITLLTALIPLWKWVWRTYGVRSFDAKKAHYDELVEQAKWYEERLLKLEALRKQLIYAEMYERPLDRFRLSELVSKLDRKDAEWARKVDDVTVLKEALERKEEECDNNAQQCREFADDVSRKVLFWP